MRTARIILVIFTFLIVVGLLERIPTIAGKATIHATSKTDIYDENVEGRAQITKALRKAKEENKRVLITWGANWCGWCHHLRSQMTSDTLITKLLKENYVSISIDLGHRDKHMDLAREYGADFDELYIAHMTILDMKGKVVGHQKSGDLAVTQPNGKRVYSKKRIAEFLKKHKKKTN